MCEKLPLKKKIDGRKSVEDQMIQLFECWNDAHLNDKQMELTMPNGLDEDKKFKKNFIPDGCVDYDLYAKATPKVLFLLKEPGCNRNGEVCYAKWKKEDGIDGHWFCKIVNQEFENGNDKKSYNKFKIMADVIGINLEKTAMVNINKRGGWTSTNNKKLYNYAKVYEDFIKKEIEILNPDIIISCIGNGGAEEVLFDIKNKSLYKTKYNNSDVYGMYHPAFFAISKADYERTFKRIYK